MDELKLDFKKWREKIMPRLLFWELVISWIFTIKQIFTAALSVPRGFLGWAILLVFFVWIPFFFLLIAYRLMKDIEKQKKELILKNKRGQKKL